MQIIRFMNVQAYQPFRMRSSLIRRLKSRVQCMHIEVNKCAVCSDSEIFAEEIDDFYGCTMFRHPYDSALELKYALFHGSDTLLLFE